MGAPWFRRRPGGRLFCKTGAISAQTSPGAGHAPRAHRGGLGWRGIAAGPEFAIKPAVCGI